MRVQTTYSGRSAAWERGRPGRPAGVAGCAGAGETPALPAPVPIPEPLD
jgi:hypothetical protein